MERTIKTWAAVVAMHRVRDCSTNSYFDRGGCGSDKVGPPPFFRLNAEPVNNNDLVGHWSVVIVVTRREMLH